MDSAKLYEEGKTHLSRALDNTQYTHVHFVDIMDGIVKNYFLPAAQDGYPPAIIEVAKYYMERGEKAEGIAWAKEYKKLTKCSRLELIGLFGISMLAWWDTRHSIWFTEKNRTHPQINQQIKQSKTWLV